MRRIRPVRVAVHQYKNTYCYGYLDESVLAMDNGMLIKHNRLLLGISQKALAEKLQISVYKLRIYERGQKSIPEDNIKKLDRIFKDFSKDNPYVDLEYNYTFFKKVREEGARNIYKLDIFKDTPQQE